MEGWFKIPRELISWRWYNEEGMLRMLLYLIERAQIRDSYVGNNLIKRGELITSEYKLCDRLDLSKRRVRLILARLQSDGYIIVKPNHRFTRIIICNIDDYIGVFKGKRTTDEPLTNRQQTANVQPTNRQQTANGQPTNRQQTANGQPTDSKQTANKPLTDSKRTHNKNNNTSSSSGNARAYACEGEEKKEVFKGEEEKNSASPTKTEGGAAVRFMKVENVAEYLRNTSDWWKERTRMTLGLSPTADLDRYIEMYVTELVAQGVTEKRADDICRHFVNMTRIIIGKEQKQQQNGAKREDGYKFDLQDVAGIVQAGMSLGAQDARKRSGEE